VEIQGRVAVVTGAAVGTGRAIAHRLAAEGASVVLADIEEVAGRNTCQEIGAAARFRLLDVRDDEHLAGLIDYAAAEFGRHDILVNNAGGGPRLRPCFPDAAVARWSASLELNLRAPMLATQLALGPMRAAGGGAVVNIGSTAGTGTGPHPSPEYSAAKAGLMRFTATLAPLRERFGVRVNCVVPDWIATERAEQEVAQLDPAERASMPPLVPLDTLTDAVIRFVRDERLAGRVMLLPRGRPPELLG